MMNLIDVTYDVDFGDADGDRMPITKCACGERFRYGEFVINVYDYSPAQCPKCGRKFCFVTSIKVYEVVS